MNRLHLLLAAAVVAASASAGAQTHAYEPKSLARYDVSYGRCEKLYPDMKGRRDEAYLSLWRATLNDKMYEYLDSVKLSDLVAQQAAHKERVNVLQDKRGKEAAVA